MQSNFFNLKRLALYRELDGDSGYEVAKLFSPKDIIEVEISESNATSLPRTYNIVLKKGGISNINIYDCIFINDGFEILNNAPIDINPLL